MTTTDEQPPRGRALRELIGLILAICGCGLFLACVFEWRVLAGLALSGLTVTVLGLWLASSEDEAG
ncbi:MAG TPA: hypothetical protein VFP72_02985 [Kineosporiaceae bacterium]|nr:hypothetical protein [Kineosporiaceae bacterium]